MKNEYFNKQFLDICKFIMSIMVVMIHTSPFRTINIQLEEIRKVLCNVAVPFFFTVSGYLLFVKMGG